MVGQSDALRSVFVGEPMVNTPMHGEIKEASSFNQFVQEEQVWLREHPANPEFFALIMTYERVKCLKFKVPKVKGTKMTITCFGPAFIGLKMGFPILSSYCRDLIISEAQRAGYRFASFHCG